MCVCTIMSGGSDDSDDDGDARGGDDARAVAPWVPQNLRRVCVPDQVTVVRVYSAFWISASCCGCVAVGAGSVCATEAGSAGGGDTRPARRDARDTCWPSSVWARHLWTTLWGVWWGGGHEWCSDR